MAESNTVRVRDPCQRHSTPDCGDTEVRQRIGTRSQHTIVHLATSPRWRARATETVGTRNVLAVAEQQGAHFVHVSIVGTNRIRLPYYKAKWVAEQTVAAAIRELLRSRSDITPSL